MYDVGVVGPGQCTGYSFQVVFTWSGSLEIRYGCG
jgi:hypothetical protein